MILGEKEFIKDLEKLSHVDMYDAVANGIKAVQSEAKMRCPVDMGELRNSIYTEMESGEGHIRGTCYTNKKYAPYVEFGTGPKGQANHEGVSPNVTVAYTQSPWWIHENQIDQKMAEKYHWFYVDTSNGRFYQCTGQAAQPFLYPALKNQEPEIEKIFKEAVMKQI